MQASRSVLHRPLNRYKRRSLEPGDAEQFLLRPEQDQVHIRIRKRTNPKTGETLDSLSLVRTVYDSEKKRSAEVYIGSVDKLAFPDDVPERVRFSDGMALTEEEIQQLKQHLAPNIPSPPDPLFWLIQLPFYIKRATEQMEAQATLLRERGESPKGAVLPHLRAAEAAWRELIGSAQRLKLKRVSKRKH